MSRSRLDTDQFVFDEYYRFDNPYPGGPPYRTNFYRSYSNDLEITQNHHVSQLGNSGLDIGGPFHVMRRLYSEDSSLGEGPHAFHSKFGPSWGDSTVTPQFAKFGGFNNSNFPTVTPTNILELLALGRQAIAAVAPTAPSFDGATFLGELREGLPHIVPFAASSKKRTAAVRNAGDEYLNVEFGWKPLLRDYHSFSNTIRNSERILDDYEKQSGKRLHRQYTFPSQFHYNETEESGFAAPLITQTSAFETLGYIGTLKTTTSQTVKRWFKGCFSYYFPPRGASMRKSSELNKLYGLKVSPDVLWNLAPWSWAADWIGDAGTFAKNISLFDSDNLIMPYAYLMETKSVKVEYQLSGIRYKTYPGEQWFRQTFETISKTRIQASPYGFDIDWPDFTAKQLAILAALGRTRV